MSTRAVYTFMDNQHNDHREFHVYKHCDGYPSGAIEFIEKSLLYAWELPRFEADEFAASFIVANKIKGGSVYLTSSYEEHSDLVYRYEISHVPGLQEGLIMVRIFERDYKKGLEVSGWLEICYSSIAGVKESIRKKVLE